MKTVVHIVFENWKILYSYDYLVSLKIKEHKRREIIQELGSIVLR